MHIEQTGTHIDIHDDATLLARLVYMPDVPANESPRPYIHPLNTRAGVTVTDFRPDDHLWHHGLSMTCAHLSGWQFWGGRTYRRDQGYVWLDNFGRQQHVTWQDIQAEEDSVSLCQRLHWIAGEQRLIAESRAYHFCLVDATAWQLQTSLALENISGQPLEFGSPTTQGRENAGYGGWFWRGSPAMRGGDVTIDGGSGEDVRGLRSPWLRYTAGSVGLLFEDCHQNPCHPTQWFVRTTGYPGVSFAFMFDTVYTLSPGDTLKLNYRITLRDEPAPRDR